MTQNDVPGDGSNFKSLNRFKRAALIAGGTLSLALGIVGAFLPVLPTTPFVLLAAICYVRSSERMYRWLMSSRFAGPGVRNVLEGKGIPLSVKVVSLAFSAVMIGYVGIFVTESFWMRMMLGLLYGVQLYFMVMIKTLPRQGSQRGEA